VSKIKVIWQLSLLWVQSGMSSMHVFVVYPVRTRDSEGLGVGSTLLPAYVLSLWILNGLWGLCPLLTLIELPSLIQFVMEYWRPPWGLRTRCRLMNAVEVGDLSFIPRSQWVKSKWFASFHSCEYNPEHMYFAMNFEWYMRIVSTSHFYWVAIPHTVCKGVMASTMGTKDPLLSDECSSSGRSELYPLLLVSKMKVVSRISLLWVQSGMSMM